MKHALSRVWNEATRGNAAILFALVLFPLIVAIGFALDMSQRLNADRHLQYAVDAAALAASRAIADQDVSEAEIIQIAENSFLANVETDNKDVFCEDPMVSVDFAERSVEVSSICHLPTIFGVYFAGQDSMEIANMSTSRARLSKLDIALALDLSGSMSIGTRLPDLKAAAKDMAATLLASGTGEDVRIAFAGYADALNAGIYGNLAQGKPFDDDSDGDGVDKVCVTERPQPAAFNDDLPGPGKWVSDLGVRCPDEIGLLPLTSSLPEFNAAIDSLTTESRTAGHLGVAWSWYLISPKWATFWPPGSAGTSNSDPDVLKVVIVMSDGEFTIQYVPGLGTSEDQALQLCSEMRDDGITIYAIGFDVGPVGEATLQACAGDSSRYFSASDGTQLAEAYATIAVRLLGTSLTH